MSIYAGEVREAVAGAVDAEKLAEAWQALHPREITKAVESSSPTKAGLIPPSFVPAGPGKTGSPATKAINPVLSAFLARASQAIQRALSAVLTRLWAEGWVLGQQAAKAVTMQAEPDWGAWTPGDYAAAEQIAGPGLRQLLGEAQIRIKSIADSRLEGLSKVLEDTLRSDAITREPGTSPLPPFLSVGDLAARLKTVLNNPARAELVARTEIARAQASAARQVYAETGRAEVEISTAEDSKVCPQCEAAAALGPHPINTPPMVPIHPACRCAELPVLEHA